jgi:hypothetical protein
MGKSYDPADADQMLLIGEPDHVGLASYKCHTAANELFFGARPAVNTEDYEAVSRLKDGERTY